MVTEVKLEAAKKIITYDMHTKETNGFVTELYKDTDKTVVYLSSAAPGAFKGFHLHRVRAACLICIKGNVKIIVYIDGKRQEYLLSSDNPQRLYIPKNIPTAYHNIGEEEAWLINYPEPAYDPNLKGEQVDFTQEELDSGEYLKKLEQLPPV
jgi:dTDP-4-dehydrorhamnose 3,5-epimerase-like enzyme